MEMADAEAMELPNLSRLSEFGIYLVQPELISRLRSLVDPTISCFRSSHDRFEPLADSFR